MKNNLALLGVGPPSNMLAPMLMALVMFNATPSEGYSVDRIKLGQNWIQVVSSLIICMYESIWFSKKLKHDLGNVKCSVNVKRSI